MNDEPRTEKEAIYDERIAPLMSQIIALCREHKINMAATFSLDFDADADQTLFCTTVLSIDPQDEKGYERIQACRATMYPPSPFVALTITSQ